MYGFGFHPVPFVEAVRGGRTGEVPADIRQVNETISFLRRTDKQAELGDVANFAPDPGIGRFGCALLSP